MILDRILTKSVLNFFGPGRQKRGFAGLGRGERP
jgi:hypothetical protein